MSSFLERIKIPHVFVLITGVTLFCSLLTYIIPSGSYERQERTFSGLTRTVVVPNTYTTVEKHYSAKGLVFGEEHQGKASPVSFVQFLTALPRGMEESSDIIFFIFIIGGVFGILQRTGTIIAALKALLDIFRDRAVVLTIVLMILIAVGGSTMGMGEEFIPLVPLFILIAIELGYDRIFGLALVMLAADVGFASATTNPFTVQIAQGIAEIEPASGLTLRIVLLLTCLTATILYLLRYGAKIKADPSNSLVAGDGVIIEKVDFSGVKLDASHIWVVVSGIIIFVLLLYGVQNWDWYLNELSGGFFLIGIIAMFVSRLSLDDAAGAFVKGMEEMIVAALVVGFARAINVVLADGQIMDTLIYSAATFLNGFPNIVAAEGMLLFQTFLNFFIPSGSGQAAVTMPLMAPLADVLGITRQTAVLAFTCGDGYSNTIIPTSGVLMAMLSLAKVPYMTWLRFMAPLFVILMLISAVFIAVAVSIGYT